MDTTTVRIRIESADELVAAREAAGPDIALREVTEPVEGEPTTLVEPVTAILVGAAVVAVARIVKDWWSRLRGGLVVDLRPEATDMFYRDRDLEFGYIATIAADGTVTVNVKDIPDAAENWISTLLGLVGKPAAEVAEAASTLIGAGKVTITSA